MFFVLVWVAILIADLLVWALLRRNYWLHLQTYRLSFLRRCLVFDSPSAKPSCAGSSNSHDSHDSSTHDVLPPKKVPERVQRMLVMEDDEATDLEPSSRVRMTVSFIVLLQNSLAICIVGGDNAIQDVCKRAGQLAFVNTIPLVLLAFPDIALSKITRQCSPEITWAHHLFGWLVWLNALVHVGLSNFTMAEPVAMIFFLFGIAGILFLYTALLVKATGEPKPPTRRHTYVTPHGVLGAAFLVSVLLHAPKNILLALASISFTLLIVGCLLRHGPSVPQITIEAERRTGKKGEQWGITCHMDNFQITDGQACYFKVNGKPTRMAWTNSSIAGTASTSLTLISSLEPGEEGFVTGPFFASHSPYVSAPNCIVIFCSYKSFAEAHSLLHARNGRTYIVWVGPKLWLLKHLMRDHQCLYRHFILRARDSDVKTLRFVRLGTKEKIAQVHSHRMQTQGSVSGELGRAAGYYDQREIMDEIFPSDSNYDSTVTESDDDSARHNGAQAV